MSKLTREGVYRLIDGERDYQDSRWNPQTTESHGEHSYEEWIMYMEDYLAEAKHALSREARQDTNFKVGNIIRKIGAMAVACMEQNGAPSRAEELTARK